MMSQQRSQRRYPRLAEVGVHFSPTSVHFAPISLHVASADPCFGPASPCLERVNRGLAANTVHPGDIEGGIARINRDVSRVGGGSPAAPLCYRAAIAVSFPPCCAMNR